MKKHLLSLSVITTALLAETTTEEKFEQGLPLPKDKFSPSFLIPAQYKVEAGWDLAVSGSFLYWNCSQEAMDVAYVPLFADDGTMNKNPTVAHHKSEFLPGYRVALSSNTGFDDWQAKLEATWYNHSTNFSFTSPGLKPSVFVPTSVYSNSASVSYIQNVQSTWKFHHYMVDLVVGRPYYSGMNLTVSPLAGARLLGLHQHLSTLYSSATGSPILGAKAGYKSWGLGPKTGVVSHYLFDEGFRFEGLGDFSLLYTRYTKIGAGVSSSLGTTGSVIEDYYDIKPTVTLGIGLGYANYMFNDNWLIDVSARYDFSVLWSQNMMRNYATQLDGISAGIGNVALHGLSVNVKLEF
jgi:hypothetical protein